MVQIEHDHALADSQYVNAVDVVSSSGVCHTDGVGGREKGKYHYITSKLVVIVA